jgi:gamma-glutamylcyclotransferase
MLASPPVTTVAYFAYGSNMDSATLRVRRGVEWTRAVPALARGWRLAVDKPSLMGTGEGMATILEDSGAEVWGVLYEISAADLEHIELTEGVLIGHYRRVEIVVETLSQGGAPAVTIPAVTLASNVRDPAYKPTTRYLGLLLGGAAEHGLPDSWIDVLRSIEAVDEAADAAALRPFFDRAMQKPS